MIDEKKLAEWEGMLNCAESTPADFNLREVFDTLQKLWKVARVAESLSSTLYSMREANSHIVAGSESGQPAFQDGVIRLLEALAALKEKPCS